MRLLLLACGCCALAAACGACRTDLCDMSGSHAVRATKHPASSVIACLDEPEELHLVLEFEQNGQMRPLEGDQASCSTRYRYDERFPDECRVRIECVRDAGFPMTYIDITVVQTQNQGIIRPAGLVNVGPFNGCPGVEYVVEFE